MKTVHRLFLSAQSQTGGGQIGIAAGLLIIAFRMLQRNLQCLFQICRRCLKFPRFLIQQGLVVVQAGHQHVPGVQHLTVNLFHRPVTGHGVLQPSSGPIGAGNVQHRCGKGQRPRQSHFLKQFQHRLPIIIGFFRLSGLPAKADQFVQQRHRPAPVSPGQRLPQTLLHQRLGLSPFIFLQKPVDLLQQFFHISQSLPSAIIFKHKSHTYHLTISQKMQARSCCTPTDTAVLPLSGYSFPRVSHTDERKIMKQEIMP